MNDAAAPGPGMAPAEPQVDRQHPWLGLDSFSEETRAYFFGREEEIAELSRRVQRKLLTILFGQSGLGKTSILRAGIVPRLRPLSYCPVYVRIDYGAEAPPPSEQIKAAILRATQAQGHWTQTGVAVEGESLWEFLHHRDDVLRDGSGKTLIPLLIFDQFEEIFTLAQTDDFARRRAAEFVDDLADLVENRPPRALEERMEQDESAAERFDFARGDYRILIALREDYLAHLEGLKGAMPSVTQNRMRLARMTGAQALEAVQKPGGRLVNDEVAEAIVRFTAGGAEVRNAEVEPALLSLVCRELNNIRIAQGRDEISADVLAGSRDTILAEFYERALADQAPGVRQVVEDHLLTESGYRESLAEERLRKLLAAAGAAPGTLEKLVDRRLLRVEERLDVRRVELTHDVLGPVVRASRDVRLEREARDEAERKLAVQREQERATRAALVRARQVAGVCAVLAVVAVASAIYGYVSTRRAQQAEAAAKQAREMAETARGESEKLVAYLLDDFYLELAPVGRLDIVGELAKRALHYYDALPADLRTSQTERNRALALVRYGTVLRTQGRLDEGAKAIDEAVGVLGRMREQGDDSETTAIGLALGLATQARLASSADVEGKALTFSQRAVEAIKPLATATDASVAARRVYGETLIINGYLQMGSNENDAAIATLDEARRIQRSIDELKLADLASAAAYAEAASWQVQTYVNMGRTEDARRAGEEALGVAARVLEKRPGHMQALRAQALAASPLAVALLDEMNLAEALRMANVAVEAWREFVKLDPGNAISWSNLGVGLQNRHFILLEMGRPGDAVATARAALAVERQAPPSQLLYDNLAFTAVRLAMVEAALGNTGGADEALAATLRLNGWVASNAPAGSYVRASREAWSVPARLLVAAQAGEYGRTLELARTAVPRVEQLKPVDVPQRRTRDNVMRIMQSSIAWSAYQLGDYATSERAAARALEVHRSMPILQTGDKRDYATEQVAQAIALARLGRLDEARQLASEALRFQRGISPRNRDDALQRLELAQALYAAAVAGLGDSQAQLAEAAAIVQKLPPEMLRLRDVATWGQRIADERARGRRS